MDSGKNINIVDCYPADAHYGERSVQCHGWRNWPGDRTADPADFHGYWHGRAGNMRPRHVNVNLVNPDQSRCKSTPFNNCSDQQRRSEEHLDGLMTAASAQIGASGLAGAACPVATDTPGVGPMPIPKIIKRSSRVAGLSGVTMLPSRENGRPCSTLPIRTAGAYLAMATVVAEEALLFVMECTTNGYLPAAIPTGISALIWPFCPRYASGIGVLFSVAQVPPARLSTRRGLLLPEPRLLPNIVTRPPAARAGSRNPPS